MVLAATNLPWRVDSALRRPGRLPGAVCAPPDPAARKAILKICLRDLPVDATDLDRLASIAERFPARICCAAESASEKAIYEEMKTGRAAKVTQKMLVDAVKATRPSTNESLETARSYATYANRAGLYDDLVAYFEKS